MSARTPEEQHIHDIAESYTRPLNVEIKELRNLITKVINSKPLGVGDVINIPYEKSSGEYFLTDDELNLIITALGVLHRNAAIECCGDRNMKDNIEKKCIELKDKIENR